MAWPERLALLIVIVEAFGFALLTIGNPHAWTPEWVVSLGALWRVPATTVLPIWLIARAIDWLLGGPPKRRGMFIVRPLP